jgi:diguanylate cyclase (GGDEF)-like protein
MARKYKVKSSSGFVIVLADDDPDYLEATRLLLESEGHEVLCVTNGMEALAVLRRRRADLLLLDYFMPGMTGEEVVVKLREVNSHIQIILQTGYVNERPPREMLRRLDIQGYYDKSEGPDKLLLWTDAGLKAATAIQRLYRSRQGLRYILDATPAMHKIQPVSDLVQGVLAKISGLLSAVDHLFAAAPSNGSSSLPPACAEGFIALSEEDSDLVVAAGTGRYLSGQSVPDCIPAEELAHIKEALDGGDVQVTDLSTIVPLRVGELTLGVIYLPQRTIQAQDAEFLKVFANQATVAIQNMQLYEMAALDPLTGVHARRFLERWMLREVRSAFRSQHPLSLLLLDMDNLKSINDSGGHIAGDQALAAMGKVLRQSTRETDLVARYGGDEFVVLLPQTSVEGAEDVALRVLERLAERTVPGVGGATPMRSSIGVSVLPPHGFPPAESARVVPSSYFQAVAQMLIRRADDALYRAKHNGRGRVERGAMAEWEPLSSTY